MTDTAEPKPATPGPAPAPRGRDVALAAPPASVRARHDPFLDPDGALLGDGGAEEGWATPWSDLMMTMFVLFAALLAAQGAHSGAAPFGYRHPEPKPLARVHERPVETPVERDREKVVERPKPAPSFAPLLRPDVYAQSAEAVRKAALKDVEVQLLHDRSVKVSVQGPLFFELGRADLRPDVRHFLDRLAAIIAAIPYRIRVVGHTDDYPIDTTRYPSNWELSLSRAARVARYLIAAGHVDPRRFVVMGRGQWDPAVPNDSAAHRARNRRVEIIITREVEPRVSSASGAVP